MLQTLVPRLETPETRIQNITAFGVGGYGIDDPLIMSQAFCLETFEPPVSSPIVLTTLDKRQPSWLTAIATGRFSMGLLPASSFAFYAGPTNVGEPSVVGESPGVDLSWLVGMAGSIKTIGHPTECGVASNGEVVQVPVAVVGILSGSTAVEFLTTRRRIATDPKEEDVAFRVLHNLAMSARVPNATPTVAGDWVTNKPKKPSMGIGSVYNGFGTLGQIRAVL